MENFLTVIGILQIAAFLILAAFIKSYLPSYMSEKGKNLATKEDIATITQEIERVRTEFLRLGHAQQKQFEKEFATYQEIWELVVEVQRTAEMLRPVLDSMPKNKDAEVQRNLERLQALATAVQNFTLMVHKRRPFYPLEVFNRLVELQHAARKEMISFQYTDPEDEGFEYWDKAQKNLAEIMSAADNIGDAIRKRLATLGGDA